MNAGTVCEFHRIGRQAPLSHKFKETREIFFVLYARPRMKVELLTLSHKIRKTQLNLFFLTKG